MEWPILTKFGTMMHMEPPDTDSQYNFVNSTIQDGGGRHLEKSKNHNIFATGIDRFWQNLACWCVSTLSTRVANKILRFQKSKTAAVVILKIRKIATSPQWNDQFSRNLAKRCVWAIWRLSANEILWIRQSKMAAATILKNRKILISPQPIDRFGRNLAKWCVFTLSAPIANKISLFQKIQDGGNGHSENSKNCNISTTRQPILTTFSTLMSLCLPDSVCQ